MDLFNIPSSNTAFYSFKLSDNFGRAIVIILIFLSVHSWTIMLERWVTVRRARKANQRFLKAFHDAFSPLDLALRLREYSGPAAAMYQAGVEELMALLGLQSREIDRCCRDGVLPRSLSDSEVARVQAGLERAMDQQVFVLEKRLGTLGTLVTLSPFLGLLGTVWGVLATFCQMAELGHPDIAAMAPGVAGALLTTVVGLLVAIPAVVGYNALTYFVRQTTVEMDHLIDDLVGRIKLLPTSPAREPDRSRPAEVRV